MCGIVLELFYFDFYFVKGIKDRLKIKFCNVNCFFTPASVPGLIADSDIYSSLDDYFTVFANASNYH